MAHVRRWLVIVVLVGLAVFLHTKLCEWSTTWRSRGGGAIVAWWAHENPDPADSPRTEYWAIAPDSGAERPFAIVYGIALPVAMLTAAACLAISSREAARRAKGLCAKCGYDLRGVRDGRCPECGRAV